MNPGHRLQISPRYINFFPPRRPEGPNKDHQRGRATDVPVPLDLTSLKFLGKMALTVPLLVALAAHLAEPGLLTKDKSKNQ